MKAQASEGDNFPRIWPSAIRLIATLSIFLFHFLGLYGYSQYRLDLYSILAFCFLSGYLSSEAPKPRLSWLKKRYLNIMIPYWIVMAAVLSANIAYSYKEISWLEMAVELAGGSMLVSDPVYVISWYITFVMLLYLYNFMESFVPRKYLFIPMIIGMLAFKVLFHKSYYFLAFLAGLRLSAIVKRPNVVSAGMYSRLSTGLFHIQKYCYAFFLIHGAVLLFFVRKTSIPSAYSLLFSFLITSVLSVLLRAVSQPIVAWANNPAAGGDEPPVASPSS